MTRLAQFLKKIKPTHYVLGFLLIVGILLYSHLGRDPLQNWDEGIYAELGRELLLTKDFMTSSWNHELWLEKPPLIAWITAAGISLVGHDEAGPRLFMPLFALLTLYFVYQIGKKLANWQTGILAMGILTNFNLFLSRSRAVNTDELLLATISGTVYLALAGAPALLVALMASTAIFAKGIAGSLAIMIAFPLILKRGRKFVGLFIGYCLLMVTPWHIYQYFSHGSSFLTPYLLEQVVRRATAPIEFHMESRYFYLEYLYTNLGFGMIFIAVASAIFLLYQSWKTKKLASSLILLWWVLVPLTIFTFAKTRIFWYILPVYPAIALLIALLFHNLSKAKLEAKMFSILVVGVCLQGFVNISKSVELGRATSSYRPGDLGIATIFRDKASSRIAYLAPKQEREMEEILPRELRLGSTFRYGGNPDMVYYSHKQITYFYDTKDWLAQMAAGSYDLGMISINDRMLLPKGYVVTIITENYLGIEKLSLYDHD